MRGRQGRNEPPRIAFGCLAMMVVVVVAAAAFLVVFLWDVNLTT